MSLLVEAVKETCSDKEAAISLGLPDPTYWSKVKTGEKPSPRVDKLTDLPEVTQRAMCKRWAKQLRMRVSDEDSREQAALELAEAAVRFLRESA